MTGAKFYVWLVVMLCAISPLSAQITSVSFNYTLNPRSDLSEVESYGYSIYDLLVGHTLMNRVDPANGKFTVLLGSAEFRYQQVNTDYTGEDLFTQLIADEFPRELFAFEYDLTFMRSVTEKWYLVTKANIGLFSDLNNIDINHFLLEGGIIPVLQFENMDVGIGPFYTYAFGNPRIIPAPYVRFKGESTSRIIFSISPPLNARLGYRFTDEFNSGILLQTIRNNYEIGNRFFSGDPVFVFSDLTLGPDLNFMYSDKVSFHLSGGYTLKREFEIKQRGESIGSTDLDKALFLSAGVTAIF